MNTHVSRQASQQPPPSRTYRTQLNSNALKVKNKAQSKVNGSTDFKITKHVTPLHHDPMVINFGRRRRPNPTGRTTP